MLIYKRRRFIIGKFNWYQWCNLLATDGYDQQKFRECKWLWL
ncbi:4526_t:CDS:2 [Dentiscutata erythropus]|uniref:4526_t:CDS:1 n=1 Tax=Dentiscutata erythropus TaxID=1348616 RepID=A0A9N9AVF3_9GLOM|nr:4526_t:CDS:2 [Dentiscutata erythropus]